MLSRMKGNIGFEEDIKPLFTERDRSHMAFMLNLQQWEDVREHAEAIKRRLQDEQRPMPPERWPAEQIERFIAWVDEGCPKYRGNRYMDFFRDLDAHTEFWDLYKPELLGEYMSAMGEFWPTSHSKALCRWRKYVILESQAGADELKQALIVELGTVEPALKKIDTLVRDLLVLHFPPSHPGQPFDITAYLDAMEWFARDRLPLDEERFNKVPDDDWRKPHAQFHTMDSEHAWFNWGGFIDCAVMLWGEDDEHHRFRKAQMAGVAFGCPLDYLFRGRGRTRENYHPDDRTLGLLRTLAVEWALDWTKAQKEVRELFRINQTQTGCREI